MLMVRAYGNIIIVCIGNIFRVMMIAKFMHHLFRQYKKRTYGQ